MKKENMKETLNVLQKTAEKGYDVVIKNGGQLYIGRKPLFVLENRRRYK